MTGIGSVSAGRRFFVPPGGPSLLPRLLIFGTRTRFLGAHARDRSYRPGERSGRLPLHLSRGLLGRRFLRQLLAGDRHQHFLLAACNLSRLFGRLDLPCRLSGLAIGLSQRMTRRLVEIGLKAKPQGCRSKPPPREAFALPQPQIR
jgi:hypothetical protein